MEVTPEEIDATFATSVRGPILMMQATVPHMPRFGRIINISSIASRPFYLEGVALYGGGKAAMDQITFTVAAEVRPAPFFPLGLLLLLSHVGLPLTSVLQLGKHGKNITVNTVAPGITTTDILSTEAMDAFDKAVTPMARVEERIGHPNDIADTILLLVQEKSRWLTGQVRTSTPLPQATHQLEEHYPGSCADGNLTQYISCSGGVTGN